MLHILFVIAVIVLNKIYCLSCFTRSLALWPTLEDVSIFGRPSRAPQQTLGHQVQRERCREHRQEEGLRRRV